MKNLYKQITNFINEDLRLINPKINGVMLLEILKYKIIDRLKVEDLNVTTESKEEVVEEITLINSFFNLKANIKNFISNKTNIRSKIEANILLICISGVITVDLKDSKTTKNFNYKCTPMTGIVLPKSSDLSIINQKNSIILEIILFDNNSDVENI